MEGNKVRCTSLYDGEAREIAHVKHVSELISKVLYRAKWDETKDKYLLPPDAPELVLAVKNAANYSKVTSYSAFTVVVLLQHLSQANLLSRRRL